ncbi:MAG: LytTR family DNA-binding domain-containing protein [Bryobacteraceae bacterium]
MMRALVVDDEELARRNLISMLDGAVEVIAEASNGIEGLEKILGLAPDVVFLDVEMPGMNGFEMLAQLSSPPLVAFVTAYDHHAVQAFEAHAVDYILKPLRRERVARAVQQLRARSPSVAPDGLRSVLRQFPAVTKIAARRGRKICLLSPREVLWIGVDDRLVFLYTAQERFLVERTIVELETMLSSEGFFRVSRGEIVNLQYARELIPRSSGTWRLILSNGQEVDVSRERSRDLRSAMGF